MRSVHELQLPEVLDFRRDDGEIRFHEQRVLVVGAAALGVLRRELIDAVGMAAARRLLLRFGFSHGYHDAIGLRAQVQWDDPLDGIRLGLTLHGLEGMVHAELARLAGDPSTHRFEAEVLWRRSYEVEQHVHHHGNATDPVCWTLAGHASGFATACLGREIYFRETRCAAVSGNHCVVEGRDAEGWAAAGRLLTADDHCSDLAADLDRWHETVQRRHEDASRRERRHADDTHDVDALRSRVEQWAQQAHVVLASEGLRKTLELSARVAPLDTSVLICGESGTGKEFVVRMIHEQSARRGQPLVCVNCAALPDTLLESELFGHVRGAFTDAVRDRAGLFEVASSGTLFLDEVGEMSPALQAKLLRALQEHEIRRVGSETSIRANPRILAATNRDLRAAVFAGTFREDLYYRLAAFVITVPPLRERRDAIPALAQEFLRQAALRFHKDLQAVAPDAMRVLLDYLWPGNVRELQHAIDRAAILATGTRITAGDLPPDLCLQDGGEPMDQTFDLERHERGVIERALAQFGGNRRRAAEALNISTVTLWRRIKHYGVRVPPYRRD